MMSKHVEQPKVVDAFDRTTDGGWCCKLCRHVLETKRGAAAHYTRQHVSKKAQRRNARRQYDDEPSIADLMIEAQMQQAMGEPVDDDWLLDSI